MIHQKPITQDFSSKLPAVTVFLSRQADVAFAYLFGSQATGRITAMSDIDIAVYLIEPYTTKRHLDLLGHLNDILKTDDIDFVVLNSALLSLKYRIIKPRQVICENQPFKRHAFESATIREYFDFHKFESRILEERFF
ncbi:MAG: nucleotidyltransferase domain-containing protein [Pseudomonadota bacterium]